jgi:hypothetical protein
MQDSFGIYYLIVFLGYVSIWKKKRPGTRRFKENDRCELDGNNIKNWLSIFFQFLASQMIIDR